MIWTAFALGLLVGLAICWLLIEWQKKAMEDLQDALSDGIKGVLDESLSRLREGPVRKGGRNDPPTTDPPGPPKGQGRI